MSILAICNVHVAMAGSEPLFLIVITVFLLNPLIPCNLWYSILSHVIHHCIAVVYVILQMSSAPFSVCFPVVYATRYASFQFLQQCPEKWPLKFISHTLITLDGIIVVVSSPAPLPGQYRGKLCLCRDILIFSFAPLSVWLQNKHYIYEQKSSNNINNRITFENG